MKNKFSKYIYIAVLISIVIMPGCGIGLTRTEAPSTPIAVYIPQSSETPTTPIWDNTQVSCDGKPFNMWGSPGTYLYQRQQCFVTVTEPGRQISALE
jgi:hypothetical protein